MLSSNQIGFYFLMLLLLGCQKPKEPTTKDQAQAVTIITTKAQDVPVTFEYVAQTQSSHLVNIQARISGFLDRRIYTEGEKVKEGQVLFLMDKKPFQAQVDAAKAALSRQQAAAETARLNLERTKPLAALNALSKKDLDEATGTYESAEASVEQAKAQLELALLNLSYCTITSPLDGVASAALKQDGSYINVQDSQLTTVTALSPIWVNFSISENEMQKFRDQGAKGRLILPSAEEYKVEVILVDGSLFPHYGQITFTEPYYNSQTGTFLLRASIDNPEGLLRPNQHVRVRLIGAKRPHAILIPQKAVQQSTKGPFVWVVGKNNKVDPRPVVLGEWHGEEWFINEGLWPEEKVVVEGTLNLYAGKQVTVEPPPSKKKKE